MTNMIVKIEWDGDDLGPTWMNLDNLCLLLFSPERTHTNLITVTEVTGKIQEAWLKLSVEPKPPERKEYRVNVASEILEGVIE